MKQIFLENKSPTVNWIKTTDYEFLGVRNSISIVMEFLEIN